MQIWKNLKYGFQEKQGRGGGVRQSGKFPDYFGFFLLKASLINCFGSSFITHDSITNGSIESITISLVIYFNVSEKKSVSLTLF